MTVGADVAHRSLGLLDLTDLGETSSPEVVRHLCGRAITKWGPVAAVCIWPRFVPVAVDALRGTDVRVATVANFPSGDEDWTTVAATIAEVLDAGADEIDVVVPYRFAETGSYDEIERFVRRVRARVSDGRVLKTILETGELADDAVVRRCAEVAVDAGTDFLKTSTGKTAVSATPRAVEILLEVASTAGRVVGVKPSGGIRTLDDAREYLGIADRVMGPDWVSPSTFRFGTSRLLDAIVDELS